MFTKLKFSLSFRNIFYLSTMYVFQSLLLHCRAGCGRTGVVLALYLMEFYSKTSTDAIQEIRKNRYNTTK